MLKVSHSLKYKSSLIHQSDGTYLTIDVPATVSINLDKFNIAQFKGQSVDYIYNEIIKQFIDLNKTLKGTNIDVSLFTDEINSDIVKKDLANYLKGE